jgi:hypothetical protein
VFKRFLAGTLEKDSYDDWEMHHACTKVLPPLRNGTAVQRIARALPKLSDGGGAEGLAFCRWSG